MRKTSSVKTLSDVQNAFVKDIECTMLGNNKGRVIFDRYIDESLKKKKTRQKRAASTEFEIHPDMKMDCH